MGILPSKANSDAPASRRLDSIQARFSIWAGLCITLTAGSIVAYSAYSTFHLAERSSEMELIGEARGASERIHAQVSSAMQTARGLAQTFGAVNDESIGLDLSREAAQGILGKALMENPGLHEVYTCWEPDAFDGFDAGYESVDGHDATGRLIASVTRNDDGFLIAPLTGYEDPKLGTYYLGVKSSREVTVFPPQLTESETGPVWTARISVPIYDDETFYGIAGVTCRLDFAQAIVDGCQLFGGATASTWISPAGDTLAQTSGSQAPDPALIATVLADHNAKPHFFNYGDSTVAAAPTTFPGSADRWWSIVHVPTSVVLAGASASLWKLLGLGGLLIAFGLTVVWFIAGGIARPVREAATMLEGIGKGEGDLTQRLPENAKGELGALAGGFNAFIAKIQRIVTSVATCTEAVGEASSGLSQTAVEMVGAAQSTSTQAGSTSTSAESVRVEVDAVAHSVKEMSSSIGEIATSTSNASGIVRSIVGVAENARGRVEELDRVSSEIEAIINLINGIAEQTNLLALNATIEAARAGEAGKGFSVVAGEVKDLAGETSSATVKIESSIQAIQRSAGEVISAIGEMSTMIERVDNITNSIAAAVEEQSTVAATIGNSVESAATGCSSIADGIQAVARTAAETTSGASQSQEAATSLSGLSTELERLIGQFRV